MRACEWVTLGYFAYVLTVAAAVGVPARQLRRATLFAVFALALIIFIAVLPSTPGVAVIRDWLPGGYLLLGYWCTGLLYRGPSLRLEGALERVDARVFATLGPLILRAPRVLLEGIEAAYLLCYPMVPAGLAAIYLLHQRLRADSYWTLVLSATFAAYSFIPLAGTRPPRALERDMWIARRALAVRRVNLAVLERGSIQVNTFPSGHAAAAVAVALFMGSVGWVWAPFAALAAGIVAGAAVGRYHYIADVVAGSVVALLARFVVGV